MTNNREKIYDYIYDYIPQEHIRNKEENKGKNMKKAISKKPERGNTERNSRVLTTQQAVEYLQTSTPTLLKMVREGKLKANKIGRGFTFLQEELDNYLRKE